MSVGITMPHIGVDTIKRAAGPVALTAGIATVGAIVGHRVGTGHGLIGAIAGAAIGVGLLSTVFAGKASSCNGDVSDPSWVELATGGIACN